MQVPKNLGILLLSIWLIVSGILGLQGMTFSLGTALAILALVSGILLLLGR